MDIYDRIRSIARKKNITLKSMSVDMGFSKSYVSQIIVDRRSVTKRLINLICSTNNISENWLRNGEGEMFATTPKPAKTDPRSSAIDFVREALEYLPPELQAKIFEFCKTVASLEESQKKSDEPTAEAESGPEQEEPADFKNFHRRTG